MTLKKGVETVTRLIRGTGEENIKGRVSKALEAYMIVVIT